MSVPPRKRGMLLPAQAFIREESISGLVLIAAAILALVWANLPFGNDSYGRFWHTTVSIDLGVIAIDETLQHWVNNGLMAIFFFVVGLEIKRQLLVGELAGRARATLPAAAALGGMVVPALIYVTLNPSGLERQGWGIVIATDIAFAVGALALLSRYVPPQARIFLLAIAIFDDLAAIAVIAVFFTEDISWAAVGLTLGIVVVVVALRNLVLNNLALLLVAGLVLWAVVFETGIHATIAGVILAALVPYTPKAGQTEPPLERFERTLHPLSSFVVIPIFALANAGIEFGGGTFADVFTTSIGLGIVLGLSVGKPVGIVLATLLATRLGLGALPAGVGLREVIGVGLLAGIGFTVSIFVTGLALTDAEHIDLAKAAIFAAFIASSIAGFLFLRLTSATEQLAP